MEAWPGRADADGTPAATVAGDGVTGPVAAGAGGGEPGGTGTDGTLSDLAVPDGGIGPTASALSDTPAGVWPPVTSYGTASGGGIGGGLTATGGGDGRAGYG